MINENSVEKVKNEIRKASKPIIVKAHNDEFNRKMLEYGKFDILLSPEEGNRKDSVRYVDSGLNTVLARIAKKSKTAIGIDLQEISKKDKKEKAVLLSKTIENIKICRKAKVSFFALNANDEKGAVSLLSTLGASSQQAKESIKFLSVNII